MVGDRHRSDTCELANIASGAYSTFAEKVGLKRKDVKGLFELMIAGSKPFSVATKHIAR